MEQVHGGDDVLPVEQAERIVWNALEIGGLERLCSTALGRAALAAFVLDQQRRLWLRFVKKGVRPHVVARPSDVATSDPRRSLRWDQRAEAILSTHRRGHPDYDRVLRVAVDALGLRGLCDPDSETAFDSLAAALSNQAAILRLTEVAAREYEAARVASAD